jgi:cell division protein FtsL
MVKKTKQIEPAEALIEDYELPQATAQQEDRSVTNKLKELNILIYGLLLILFLGFAGLFVGVSQMMVDSLRNKQSSTLDLSNKISEQNEKINQLTTQVNNLTKALSDEQKTIQQAN